MSKYAKLYWDLIESGMSESEAAAVVDQQVREDIRARMQARKAKREAQAEAQASQTRTA